MFVKFLVAQVALWLVVDSQRTRCRLMTLVALGTGNERMVWLGFTDAIAYVDTSHS
jgi:hypothetical protein